MRMLDMLRAMDAFVGDQDDGGAEAAHGASCACDACMDRDERLFTVWHEDDGDDGGAITCHKCGAPVDDDALALQTDADGRSRLAPGEGIWYCRDCFMAGLRRVKAWIATGGAGAMGEDGE